MKNCLKCGAENTEKANFCENCGSPFEKRCPSCNTILERVGKFCYNCGAPLNNATPEAPAENVIEPKPDPVQPPYTAPAYIPPKKKAGSDANIKELFGKIFYYVKLSLTPLLALIMFIMSFFGVTTLDFNDNVNASLDLSEAGISTDLSEELMDELSDLQISSLQIIEGAFARIAPKSDEKVAKDFQQFIQDHATKRQESKLNSNDEEEVAEALVELLEDYNVLLLMSMESIAENTPSVTLQLFELAAFALLQIGLTLALFVVSLIRFINGLTNKEKNRRAPFKLLAFTLGSAICFGFLVRLTMQCAIGSGLKGIIILGWIAVFAELAFRVIDKEITFKKQTVISIVAAATGIVLFLPLMTFACSPLLSAAYENGGLKYTENFTAASLIESWDMLKTANSMEKLGESVYGAAEQVIPALLNGSYSEDLTILNPAYMGVLGLKESEVGVAVLGVVLHTLIVVFLIVAAFGIIDCINAIHSNRSVSLLFPILTFSLNIAILILSIVYAATANNTLESTSLDYKASVAAALIIFTVFCAIDLTQTIVFKRLSRSRKTGAQPQPKSIAPQPQYAEPTGGNDY